MKIQGSHEFQKRRRRSIPLSIIHVLECFLRVIKGHRSRILMFTVFAWYKWRNCTQSRLVLGKLYTIAVFLNNDNALKFSFLKPHKNNANTKYEREYVHVQNDANTYTHFYAHPYTRKRISHTRDCNLIALNTSHNGHLPLTYSFLLCASLVLLL